MRTLPDALPVVKTRRLGTLGPPPSPSARRLRRVGFASSCSTRRGPTRCRRCPGGESVQSPSTLWGIVPGLGRVGITRLVTSVGANGAASFGDEYARLAGILDAASRLPDLGDRPLVVVMAASEPLDGWLVDQDHLATLSTNVSHRIFPGLTHLSLVDSAPGATAASDAIVAAVMSVRSGTPLDAK